MSMTTTQTGYARTGTTPSVADLLLRARNGDQAAWDEILHRHGKRVFATVRSFRLQEADTLDAVQTTREAGADSSAYTVHLNDPETS